MYYQSSLDKEFHDLLYAINPLLAGHKVNMYNQSTHDKVFHEWLCAINPLLARQIK